MTKSNKNSNTVMVIGFAFLIASVIVAIASNGSTELAYVVTSILGMFAGATISGSALIYKMLSAS